jgi:exosome complex component RRP46
MSVVVETGILLLSDGSSQWKCGTTKVICSVSGPLEAKPRDEIPTAATLEIVFRPVIGLTTTREAVLQDRVYCALSSVVMRNLHPRTLIQIVVQTLEPGEPKEYNVLELAAGINAASVALLDAGIPLQGLVIAVAVAIVNGKIIINPLEKDLASSSSTHAIAYEFRNGDADRLLLCESTGLFSKQELLIAIDSAIPATKQVYSTVRDALEVKVKHDFIWKLE